jgi:hypothetical protein
MASEYILNKPAAETVDYGGEVDYSNFEWFKEGPPTRTPMVVCP